MVPFERALVSFYRSSIVTFPPSLRVSEIFPPLFSRTPFFPTPPIVSPNFPMFPSEYVDRLFATKIEDVKLIAVQLLSKISNLCDHNQATSQTDGRHVIARPRFTLKCIAR